MPYVLAHGKSPHGTDWLNESACECYLPILGALERLKAEGIKPRWTINITPVLAEQLEDESFKAGFEEYCQEKIDAAHLDLRRFASEGPLWMEGLSSFWITIYSDALRKFKSKWNRSIVAAFKEFQDEGYIEIITCCATHGYLPLLGTEESVSAQIKLGVDTYEKHFGRKPRGIWISECAYRPKYDWKQPVGAGAKPWPRRGVDEYLKLWGLEYFFVDSHMIRGGEPLGTYGSQFPQLAELFARAKRNYAPPAEWRSEYEFYELPTGLKCFARDPQTTLKVWSGDHGYPGNEFYLEFHKQLYPGRHKYWRISQDKRDLGAKAPYDPYSAFEQIDNHANDFVNTLKNTLAYYKGLTERDGTLVAMYDTELFGHWWWEGPEFLYKVARSLHKDGSVEMVSGGDMLDHHEPHGQITLPEGSWGEGGYHHIWLNEDNVWMWEKLYPLQKRFQFLAQKLGNGPSKRVMQQAAREMLLAEASDWPFLISTRSARDYSEVRFLDHIARLSRLLDIAEMHQLNGELKPEDEAFLIECESKDAPFKDIDLDYWTLPAGVAPVSSL